MHPGKINIVKSPSHLNCVADSNNAAVLAIARTGEHVTRAQLSESLQVTQQAISKILGRLIQQGLMEETGSMSSGPGKPVSLYRIIPESRKAIGLHLTHTRLHGVVVDLTGDIVERNELYIGHRQPVDELVSTLSHQAQELADYGPGQLVGVGVGVPGPVEWSEGIYRGTSAPDPWRGAPLRQLLVDELDLPVLVDHDSRAALVGEAWSQPQILQNAVLVLVEDGLGAGVSVNGTIVRGAHTHAGEVGHTVVQLDGTPCPCGRDGCAQAEYLAALQDGDEQRAARILATVVLNLVRLMDVDRVVLGGSTLQPRQQISLDAVRAALAEGLQQEPWVTVDVVPSIHGDDLIAVGAASEVLEYEYGIPKPLAGPTKSS